MYRKFAYKSRGLEAHATFESSVLFKLFGCTVHKVEFDARVLILLTQSSWIPTLVYTYAIPMWQWLTFKVSLYSNVAFIQEFTVHYQRQIQSKWWVGWSRLSGMLCVIHDVNAEFWILGSEPTCPRLVFYCHFLFFFWHRLVLSAIIYSISSLWYFTAVSSVHGFHAGTITFLHYSFSVWEHNPMVCLCERACVRTSILNYKKANVREMCMYSFRETHLPNVNPRKLQKWGSLEAQFTQPQSWTVKFGHVRTITGWVHWIALLRSPHLHLNVC